MMLPLLRFLEAGGKHAQRDLFIGPSFAFALYS